MEAGFDDECAGKVVYGSQQPAYSLWLGEGSAWGMGAGRERSAQIGGCVAFGAARSDCVTENEGTNAPYPVGLVNGATPLQCGAARPAVPAE